MCHGMKFNPKGKGFFPDVFKMLDRTLCPALGPTELLAFNSTHDGWKLCRGFDFRPIYKYPSLLLSTIAQIQVLRQSIILPVPRIHYTVLPPYTSSTIKIYESLLPVTANLLHQKVGIQSKCLQPGQQGISLIQVSPAALNHACSRFRKI